MLVTLLIPIYNEEELLPAVLERIRATDYEKELVLVDDCSTDRTPEILAAEAGKPGIKVVSHNHNQGKGRAIRTGLEHVTGDVVVIQDADMEYDPQEIPTLVEPIVNGEADVVYGSRFMGRIVGMRLPNRVANFILATTVSVLYGHHISDEATAYKAFRRDVIRDLPLRCERFEFCPEVTAKVLRRKLRVKEVPITYHARTFEEGKKIGWRDFIVAMWTLIRYRFGD